MTLAQDIARILSLEPHPEGGFFRETFRSDVLVATSAGPRPAATGILFLVTAASPSRFHRLRSDELWLYHSASPLELVSLLPDGSSERVVLAGADALAVSDEDLAAGDRAQGCLAGRPRAGRRTVEARSAWTLVSCVVTPGSTTPTSSSATATNWRLLTRWTPSWCGS